MPTPCEGIAPEQALWLGVILQQVQDSLSLDAHPTRRGDRERARAFLGRPSAGLHVLLLVVGVEPEHWHEACLPVLRQAWALGDRTAAGTGRANGAVPRLLREVALARDAERERRRRERLEEAHAGYRQALARCGYSSDPQALGYLDAPEAPRAS